MSIYKNPKTVMLENNIKVNERGIDISQINIAPDPENLFKHGPRYKVTSKDKNNEFWIPMDPNTSIPIISRIKSRSNKSPSSDIIRYVCGLGVYANEEIRDFINDPHDQIKSKRLQAKCNEYVDLKSKNQYIDFGYSNAMSKYNDDRMKGKAHKL